jgi:hypothetical protein
MMKNTPTNLKLYNKVKEEAKKRFTAWPSAYGSAWLVKEYKRRGGTYKITSKSTEVSGLTRWFSEKWINVCKLPKKVSCGRPKRTGSIEEWRKKYPYCRPSLKVTTKSPTPYTNLSRETIRTMCKKKRKDPKRRMSRV